LSNGLTDHVKAPTARKGELMDLELQDGGVLVTGGSGGMGRAIVRAYAAEVRASP
jgi:FlaA1/EpsC-like NDP-sugar epimerase